MKHLASTVLLVVMVTAIPACSRTPAEPDPKRQPSASASAAQRPADLVWTLPPGWTTERTARKGTQRAKVKVPSVGDDKLDAELWIYSLGKKKTELDAEQADWVGEFEQLPNEPERQNFEVGKLEVRVVEVAGTYKYAMGPPMDGKKRHAMHVIKKSWRGIAGWVVTPYRGVWRFKLIGPDETVAAARAAFLDLLRSVK